MTLRPHRAHPNPSHQNPLDYEIAQEQASALGRLGRALESALAALSEYDGKQAERSKDGRVRAKLVADAGYALWCFVVQREACGMRDARLIMREYKVPPEVQGRMGVFDRK